MACIIQLGSMMFDEYLPYAYEHWNSDNPRSSPFLKATDLLVNEPTLEWGPDDIERIYNFIK